MFKSKYLWTDPFSLRADSVDYFFMLPCTQESAQRERAAAAQRERDEAEEMRAAAQRERNAAAQRKRAAAATREREKKEKEVTSKLIPI